MLVLLVKRFNKKLRFFFHKFCFFRFRFYLYDIAVSEDLDSRIGADDGTQAAAGAVIFIFFSRQIARFIGFRGNNDTQFGADGDTQAATLTSFRINFYFSAHGILIRS